MAKTPPRSLRWEEVRLGREIEAALRGRGDDLFTELMGKDRAAWRERDRLISGFVALEAEGQARGECRVLPMMAALGFLCGRFLADVERSGEYPLEFASLLEMFCDGVREVARARVSLPLEG